MDTLSQIERNTKDLVSIIPKVMEDQTGTLASAYEKAGQASRQSGSTTVPGLGDSGASSLGPGAERAIRAQLYTQTQGMTGRRPMDPIEAELEGVRPGGRPGGSSLKETWKDRVNVDEGNSIVLPRFPGANPNPRDYLDYMSTVAANAAAKRQEANDRAAAQAREQAVIDAQQRQAQVLQNYADQNQGFSVDSTGALSYGGKAQSLPPEIQKRYDTEGQIPNINADQAPLSTGFGKVSDLLNQAGEGYAQGRYIKGIVGQALRPVSHLQSLGYQTGAQGGSPGVFGLRSPFSDAVGQGLGQITGRIGFAASNHVTPGQAESIYQNLYGQGWLQGPQTNDMRTAAAQITQQNPFIGTMPQTYAMMDQATRQGATSLSKFVQIMGQVPQSALAAHTSIAQTMADMDQLGQMNKQTGGTYGAGLQNAQAWQSITGLPAGVMGTLMQNSYVQGQTFMGTGLMPFEQGLATPGQHTQGILSSLNLLSGIIPTPGGIRSPIGNTGFASQISGKDQKEALMAKLMGVDKATIHTMMTNRRGYQIGANFYDESNAYADQVTRDVQLGTRRGNQAALNTLGGTGPGTIGQIRSDMKSAVDAQGHKVFEDWGYYNQLRHGSKPVSMSEAHRLAQERARHNVLSAGQPEEQKFEQGLLSSAGSKSSKAEIERQIHMLRQGKTPTNLSGQVMHDVADAQRKEMQKYQNANTQKFGSSGSNPSGPRVTIELGPAAKKMMHLSSPQAQQKAQSGAGSVDINTQAYAPGSYTVPPMPNLDTAGGSGTYNYGSQYDTSSSGM